MANTKDHVDPHAAVEQLRDALAQADIVLPSLAVDPISPDLRLVCLGNVRADVVVNPAVWGEPGDEDDNTDIEEGDGGGGNPSPGHR